MRVGQKIDSGMLPQSHWTLESQSVDKLRGEYETGLRGRKTPSSQHGREESNSSHIVAVTPAREAQGVQYVFVLDKQGNPLMPCHPIRARQLLKRGRAVVVHRSPFIIRLKDRIGGATQPIGLGVDPGSRTSGMAVFRIDNNGMRYILFRLEITHRSFEIIKKMLQRKNYRKGRRSRNLRYRQPRFNNRSRKTGWLPPSLYSRVQHIATWTKRFQRGCPLSVIEMESVRFDMQALQNPEISNVEYQQGTLFGFEVREYLLLKWNHACAYCDATDVVLNIDHIRSRSKGGSNRVSNLAVACRPCNEKKDTQDVDKFVTDSVRLARIQRQAKASLRDAAAVNSTRPAVLRALQATGLLVNCSSGGQTKWNRTRFGVPKTHTLDAACVGDMVDIHNWNGPTLSVKAMGRGVHARTRPDRYGFPRLPLPRIKIINGFQTGDLIKADIPKGKNKGVHVGRIAVRSTGSMRVGKVDGINVKYCQLLQYADGYERI